MSIFITTENISKEIQQLINSFQEQLNQQYPELIIKVNQLNIQSSLELNQLNMQASLELNQLNMQSLLELNQHKMQSSLEFSFEELFPSIQQETITKNELILTELEQRIINGIQKSIKHGISANQPPKLPSNTTSLTQYNNILEDDQYTQTSVYFEIGRILKDITIGIRRTKRIAEIQRLFQQYISTINFKSRALMAIRLYEYFQNKEYLLIYKKIDSYFKPSIIGKLSNEDKIFKS
ncbi:2932_t:CDS:2 [Ambispora leptoticha]|uniref:2932_t:CDS:1 n=1 Tax=Ambispora leptoticha TaxID=144679 RepID=A0A9N9A7C9_9GLOM|nr:2932_t:CDS:2 [Ambispora leptoticha]